MFCVHLGPGRLGLGLVVDSLLALGLDVCLVGACGHFREVVDYEISFVGDVGGPQARRVRWACNPAFASDLDALVVERLRSDEPVLITGSLGGHAVDRAELLREIIALRPTSSETVVMACEAKQSPMYAEVTRQFAHVYSTACVMDRVVNWRDPWHYPDRRRRVVAHPTAQWVIRHPSPDSSAIIRQLRQAPPVVIVEHEDLLAAYRKRKEWGVNSVHFLMALVQRLLGEDVLPPQSQARRLSDLEARVQPLMATVMEVIAREHPGLPFDSAFVAERLRVFRETPNSAERVLAGRLARGDLRGLFGHLDTCVGNAARTAHRLGISCERFEEVVVVVLETLEARPAYFGQVDGARLDRDVDEGVVQSLRQVVGGWMNERRAEDACNRLARLLSIHRTMQSAPPAPP